MRESTDQTEERAVFAPTGAQCVVLARFERRHEFLGDLQGEWARVRFEDGLEVDVRADDLAPVEHKPDAENEGWCVCGGQVQYFERSFDRRGQRVGYGCSRADVFETTKHRRQGR